MDVVWPLAPAPLPTPTPTPPPTPPPTPQPSPPTPMSSHCRCNSPFSLSPGNGFTCDDASKSAYCSPDAACVQTEEWEYTSDWSEICQVVCTCGHEGSAVPKNDFVCSDGYSAYCSPEEVCFGHCRKGDWGCLCRAHANTTGVASFL